MPAGRPEKPIDKKTFEKLCGMQATEEEICGFFDVTDKTLAKWCRKTYGLKFSEVFRIKRGIGKRIIPAYAGSTIHTDKRFIFT